MSGASASLLGSSTTMATGVKQATGGLLNITAKFIVPIATLATGWATGSGIGWKLGDFLCNFIPGLKKIADMVTKRDSSIAVVHLLGGAIVVFGGIGIAYIAKSFFGDGIIATILFRGILGFCLGAGLHTMVAAMGPLDQAINRAVGG